MDARDHLAVLEKRLKQAAVGTGEEPACDLRDGSPDLVSVILNAHGFSNLLEQVSFLQADGHQDAQIVGFTRTARREVLHETVRLGNLEARDRNLTDQILQQRNQVAALESALLTPADR